jgi:cytochrome c-L
MTFKSFINAATFGIGVLAMSTAHADITLRNSITGEVLDLSFAKKGGNTEVFKQFMQTGKNPYNGNEEAIKKR